MNGGMYLHYFSKMKQKKKWFFLYNWYYYLKIIKINCIKTATIECWCCSRFHQVPFFSFLTIKAGIKIPPLSVKIICMKIILECKLLLFFSAMFLSIKTFFYCKSKTILYKFYLDFYKKDYVLPFNFTNYSISFLKNSNYTYCIVHITTYNLVTIWSNQRLLI